MPAVRDLSRLPVEVGVEPFEQRPNLPEGTGDLDRVVRLDDFVMQTVKLIWCVIAVSSGSVRSTVENHTPPTGASCRVEVTAPRGAN